VILPERIFPPLYLLSSYTAAHLDLPNELFSIFFPFCGCGVLDDGKALGFFLFSPFGVVPKSYEVLPLTPFLLSQHVFFFFGLHPPLIFKKTNLPFPLEQQNSPFDLGMAGLQLF